MGLADAVPEKKLDTVVAAGMPKFLIDLISGGYVASLRALSPKELIRQLQITNYTSNDVFVGAIKPLNLTLSFAFKENYKSFFLKGVDKNERLKFFQANFNSGFVAGATATCFCYNLERAFARSAVLDAPTPLVTHHGLLGRLTKTLEPLNKGFFGSLQFVAFHRGLYFGLYDTVKGVNSDGEKRNFFVNFGFALATTPIAELISYPCYMALVNPSGLKDFEDFSSKFAKMRENQRKIMKEEGKSAKYHYEFRKSLKYVKDSTTSGIKSVVLSTGFMVRSLTGALALAGFDEIQKLLPEINNFVLNKFAKFLRGIQ